MSRGFGVTLSPIRSVIYGLYAAILTVCGLIRLLSLLISTWSRCVDDEVGVLSLYIRRIVVLLGSL